MSNVASRQNFTDSLVNFHRKKIILSYHPENDQFFNSFAMSFPFQPSILFAGEHCHSNFYSTVHGAYLCGRNTAQIIYRPDSPQEIVMENDSTDLSAWIQGISLE